MSGLSAGTRRSEDILIKCAFPSTKFSKHICPRESLVASPSSASSTVEQGERTSGIHHLDLGAAPRFDLRGLSAETSPGDRRLFPCRPSSSGVLAELARMTTRGDAISQLRRVVILEGPSLSGRVGRALLHHQLLLALRDRQALVAAAVPDVISLKAERRGG